MKVHLNFVNNLHFKAQTRHFTDIEMDEPESFHGTDQGPSSIEYLLIGVGGCLGSSFVFCLQKNNVEIENLNMVVEGTLKHVMPKMHLRLIKIECEIIVSAKSEFNHLIDTCVKEFKEHCVINESITKGIPLKTKIHKKEK